LFKATTFLTNFLHMRHMNLTYKVIVDQNANSIAHGCVGDFYLQVQN